MPNAIDGIGQINVTQLVTQLMSIETGQQDKLKTQQTSESAALTAYKLLNTNTKAVLTAAESIIGSVLAPQPWLTFSVSSTDSSVSGSATSSALKGTYAFDVTAVASAQKSLLSEKVASLTTAVATADPTVTVGTWDENTGTVTGTPQTLNLNGDYSLQNLISVINASDLGVKASAINVGDGYRLQLSSAKTGAANAFSLDGLDAAVVGTATRTAKAADAEIRFGSGLADTAQSATNTFSNVFTGVTFTVSKVVVGKDSLGNDAPGTGVTLTVADNASAMSDQVKSLVDNMNVLLNTLKSQTAYDATNKTAGPLLGDRLPLQLSSDLMDSVVGAASTTSLKAVGLEVNRDGTIKFDSSTFLSYLQSDPDKARELVTTMATAAAETAKAATDFSTGSISLAVTSKQEQIDYLGSRIADWDTRLAAMKARYEKQFSALNTTLTNMNNQYSALAGQMNALMGSSSS